MSSQPPPLPPRAIDYASRVSERRRTPILSARVAAHVWAMSAAAGMACFLGIPKLEQVLKDFKVELPPITKITLLATRFITNDYGWIAALPLAIGLPFGITALLKSGNPTPEDFKRREIWTGRLLRLAMVLLLVWIALAMFLPYAALLTSISGSGGKK